MASEDKPSQVCVPTEIILEILLRLPVVSLLRCKCVCKLWFSLISDPYFINQHVRINDSAHHLRRRLVLTNKTILNSIKTFHLCDVLHDEAAKALEIDHPFKDEVQSVWIVGSCNGLLFLHFWDDHDTTCCIWNPSTRRSSKRFSSRRIVYGIGFGYDESTDDYKVAELCLPLNNGTRTLTAYIYSLKSGNWKHFTHNFQGSLYFNGTFWNGGLHWLAKSDNIWDGLNIIVISFDLATETFGEISLPPYDYEDYSRHFKLGNLGEWLCVQGYNLGKNRGDLWVMKKVYGVTSSWIKLFSIQHPIDFRRSPWDAFFAPLCILDDGKILLQLRSKFVLYDPKNSSLSEIQSVDKYWHATTFVESLVSPDSH